MSLTVVAASALPFLLTEVEVRRVERLTPAFVRVELGADELAHFGVDGPTWDQRVKLIFPGACGRVPSFDGVNEDNWHSTWTSMPEDERGHMRTYTIRDVVGSGVDTRLVIDLVLHLADGASGPGSLWAAAAQVGDRIGLLAPRRGVPFGGIEFTPGAASRLLFAADETAVPAVASIMADLPVDAAGSAYLEVPSSDDIQEFPTPAGVRVIWLPRNELPHGHRLCQAVLTLFGIEGRWEPVVEVDPELWETPTYSSSGEEVDTVGAGPTTNLYAWIAGESGAVTTLRRHLVRDAGLDRRQVAFMGYWRQGVAMRS